ncbi:MAG: fibronectin type III domain-containing protein [Candidatus Nomurabacteria bacterium]|jgi:hypothetical protein|nr:fibronectin type III domain-containing protein [Candidatus Nomurabacteria bacterium]
MKIKFNKIAAAAALAAVMAIGGLGGRAWAAATQVDSGLITSVSTTTQAPYYVGGNVNITAQITDQAKYCYASGSEMGAIYDMTISGETATGTATASDNDSDGQADPITVECYDSTDVSGNYQTKVLSLGVIYNDTPPTAPGNLTAAVDADGNINLSWTASADSDGIDGYEVDWSSLEDCDSQYKTATVSGQTLTYQIPAGQYSLINIDNVQRVSINVSAYDSKGVGGAVANLPDGSIVSTTANLKTDGKTEEECEIDSSGHTATAGMPSADQTSGSNSSSAKKSDASGIGKTGLMSLTSPALILGGGVAAILAAWLIGRKVSKISARR